MGLMMELSRRATSRNLTSPGTHTRNLPANRTAARAGASKNPLKSDVWWSKMSQPVPIWSSTSIEAVAL